MPSNADADRTGPGPDAKNTTELETPRLILGFGTDADVHVLFPYVHGEPGREVTRTLVWDGPERPEDMAEFYRLHTAGTFVPHGFHWLLRDRTGELTGEAGRAMGSLGIRHAGVPGRGDIGYWIAPPFWGRGLMREALVALIRHAFGPLNMAKVEATVYTSNDRSLALLDGLGFRREGLLRRNFRKCGQWVDVIAFGMLPGELVVERDG
jgi:RimJ/RimL family protein N-acetyltransferase